MPAPSLEDMQTRKILCIKNLREDTGAGLREAKNAVDAYCHEALLPGANPDFIWERMKAAALGRAVPVMPAATIEPVIAPANFREAVRQIADRAALNGQADVAMQLYRVLLDYPDNAVYTIE